MKFSFVFKTTVSSEYLAEYAQDKFLKFTQHLSEESRIHVTFSAQQYACEVTVLLHNGANIFHCSAHAASFTQAIDQISNKLLRQITRARGKSSRREWRDQRISPPNSESFGKASFRKAS